jgi:hypothetical protein
MRRFLLTSTCCLALLAAADLAEAQTRGSASLPAATTAQLYGGSGAAGSASVVGVGTGLALSGGSLYATGTSTTPLGSTCSATAPSRSGDVTTGLASLAGARVDICAGGSQAGEFSGSGTLTLGASGQHGIIQTTGTSGLYLNTPALTSFTEIQQAGTALIDFGESVPAIYPHVPLWFGNIVWTNTHDVAPLFQNVQVSGTTSASSAGMGLWMHQSDNSSNTGGNQAGLYELLSVDAQPGGVPSSMFGTRNAAQIGFTLNVPSANLAATEYGGMFGPFCNLLATDGPANNTLGGSCFGLNPIAHAGPNIYAQEISVGEADNWIESGATVLDSFGWKVASSNGTVSGAVGHQAQRDDAALLIGQSYISAPGQGWRNAFQIGSYAGFFAGATDGNLMTARSHVDNLTADPQILANGLYFPNLTITNQAINFGGKFIVTGAGGTQATSLTTNGGEFAHRNAISDANYTATSNDDVIAYTTLTASRTLTIPCASLGTATNPQKIIVKDESGSAGTFPISLAATIDGSTTKAINTAYGSMRLYANGAACFTW